MQEGDIIRYLLVVSPAFREPAWYIDETDSIEKGAWVDLTYGVIETFGEVTTVVRCIYPYVPYPFNKTKNIIGINKDSPVK